MGEKNRRVPDALLFRLSNESSWASEPWTADGPASLAAGIRRAWAPLVEAHRRAVASRAHEGVWIEPQIALRRRLVQIDRWIEERRARPGVAPDVRAGWERQAIHWRHQATIDYGVDDMRLSLQLRCPDQTWSGPTSDGASAVAPLVSPTITRDEVERRRLWECSRQSFQGVLDLLAFCGKIAEPDRPALRVVMDNP